MNLVTFDLNLLLVFEAVLRERSVTKAGERLRLSQPAMSHALNRLRYMLHDQLFVRTPDGMMPTPRAERLAHPVRQALTLLQSALDPEDFVPALAEQRFRLAVDNYAAVAVAGSIVAECARSAPSVLLSLRPSGTLNLPDLLDRGDLDVAITHRTLSADRFASTLLLEDHYVAVMRRDHASAREPFDLDAVARLSHLKITSSGEDTSFVDIALSAGGLSRKIGAEAPYLASGTILAQSDMIAILGAQLAAPFRKSFGIEARPLPFVTPPLCSFMIWHKRFEDHAAHRWLRGTISKTAAGFKAADRG